MLRAQRAASARSSYDDAARFSPPMSLHFHDARRFSMPIGNATPRHAADCFRDCMPPACHAAVAAPRAMLRFLLRMF